jgi:hypothetical protein
MQTRIVGKVMTGLRRFFMPLVLILVLCNFGWGQGDAPMRTSLCELFKSPQQYSGKMVEIQATIVDFRDPSVELPSFAPHEACSAYLNTALELPQNVSHKPPFELVKDESFKKYEDAIRKPMRIEATLEGRFEVASVWKDRKRVKIVEGVEGYGKKHTADARLILRRISDVATQSMPRR